MKNYKYIIFAFAAMLFASCEDDVLDVVPKDALAENTAFASPSTIELAMNGVYDAAQSGFYRGQENNNRGYIFGAAHIQQSDMRGEDMLLINTFYDFTYRSTYSPTTENNRYFWENGYRVNNLANLFIQGVEEAVEGAVIDEATGSAYIAEARFLRAITYHEMVLHFARPYRDGNGSSPGLPIVLSANNGPAAVEENEGLGRSTVAQTYAQILEDLDFAEANLPDIRDSRTLSVTRATSGAAIAFKTRVKLHMADYAGVIEEGNKIVSNSAPFSGGGYALEASAFGPFENNTSSESIFSMNMSANDNLNTNSALANMYGSSSLGARGEVAISPIIWNQNFWHPDDLRRSGTFIAAGASGRLFTTKYNDYVNNADFSPILRYAEVLLNVAEAEARSGNSTRGSELLNAVRDRNITGSMTSYGMVANTNVLIGRILEERRIEYLGEGQRWKDIHRNAVDPDFSTGGTPAKMLSADVNGSTYEIGTTDLTTNVGAIPYADFRFLWPLPATETAINPTLADQQNPGY